MKEKNMPIIKQFNAKSIASLYGFFLALSAFLTGLGIAAVNIINRLLAGGNTFMSIVLVIIFNILYGILVGLISALAAAIVGYVCGYIFAWLYNLCVRRKLIGGIKMEIE